MAGLDFETEAELMKDEQAIAKGLPSFTPTPYSPPPPMIGGGFGAGRPVGSQNKPINQRNSGVSPSKQKPTSKVRATAEEVDDDTLIGWIDEYAKRTGIRITMEDL